MLSTTDCTPVAGTPPTPSTGKRTGAPPVRGPATPPMPDAGVEDASRGGGREELAEGPQRVGQCRRRRAGHERDRSRQGRTVPELVERLHLHGVAGAGVEAAEGTERLRPRERLGAHAVHVEVVGRHAAGVRARRPADVGRREGRRRDVDRRDARRGRCRSPGWARAGRCGCRSRCCCRGCTPATRRCSGSRGGPRRRRCRRRRRPPRTRRGGSRCRSSGRPGRSTARRRAPRTAGTASLRRRSS